MWSEWKFWNNVKLILEKRTYLFHIFSSNKLPWKSVEYFQPTFQKKTFHKPEMFSRAVRHWHFWRRALLIQDNEVSCWFTPIYKFLKVLGEKRVCIHGLKTSITRNRRFFQKNSLSFKSDSAELRVTISSALALEKTSFVFSKVPCCSGLARSRLIGCPRTVVFQQQVPSWQKKWLGAQCHFLDENLSVRIPELLTKTRYH